MKRSILGIAVLAVAALGACTNVKVDESTVFAPEPFDAQLAQSTGEKIEGEKAYASEGGWKSVWAARIADGRLTAPAPAYVTTKVEHGKLASGLAWSMISREGAGRPLIVRCGGNASTRQHTGFTYSVTAIGHGDVFLFDYPGSGETGGDVTTPKFLAMIDSVEAEVRARAAGRTLILWGHSLGGFVCADLARRLPETDGVILETTARNAGEVAKAWTPWYAGPFVHITIAPGLEAYDTANSLKAFKGPVLVLGATKDKTLPVQLARSLDKALKAQGSDVEYVEFPEGGHSSLPGQAGYAKAIDGLFARVHPAS
jgi:pimeloyl-ACP methyl ester carboxylesterase